MAARPYHGLKPLLSSDAETVSQYQLVFLLFLLLIELHAFYGLQFTQQNHTFCSHSKQISPQVSPFHLVLFVVLHS